MGKKEVCYIKEYGNYQIYVSRYIKDVYDQIMMIL